MVVFTDKKICNIFSKMRFTSQISIWIILKNTRQLLLAWITFSWNFIKNHPNTLVFLVSKNQFHMWLCNFMSLTAENTYLLTWEEQSNPYKNTSNYLCYFCLKKHRRLVIFHIFGFHGYGSCRRQNWGIQGHTSCSYRNATADRRCWHLITK